ncbi:MAG: DUF6446 family protein [Pseudorhodobacter sp.]
MTGRIAAIIIILSAVLVGGAVYYLQVYGYYNEIDPASAEARVMITRLDGSAEKLAIEDFRGIDAESSPIRYRACFRLAVQPERTEFLPYEGAEPLVAPNWFDCFDAQEIGTALEDGIATIWLGTENHEYGIDRVIAVMPDGRGFSWPQINRCGREVFDGKPAPADCPPPPSR